MKSPKISSAETMLHIIISEAAILRVELLGLKNHIIACGSKRGLVYFYIQCCALSYRASPGMENSILIKSELRGKFGCGGRLLKPLHLLRTPLQTHHRRASFAWPQREKKPRHRVHPRRALIFETIARTNTHTRTSTALNLFFAKIPYPTPPQLRWEN